MADAASVPVAIAGVLNLAHAPHVPPERHVVASIAAKRMLIVLDNFEHLVGATDLPAVLLNEPVKLFVYEVRSLA